MKLTKKLFMSIMTLALVVITLSASTFAWFTLGNEADLENVQVNVTTGTGMEISKDGKSWKNRIELANPSGLEFTAVTSFDGINFFDTLDGALTEANNAAAANVKYYEQAFYVRVTKNTNQEAGFDGISLISASGVAQEFTTDADRWLCDVSLGTTENNTFTATQYKSGDANSTIVEGQYREFDALNAVKVSFTPVKANATAKVYAFESDEAWGSVPSITTGDYDAQHTGVKLINSGLSYDYAVAKSYDMERAQPFSCGATAFPTYITDTDITDGTAATATPTQKENLYILVKTDFVSATAAKETGGILADVQGDLDAGYMYAKVTIRIWIEGWDADCINAILGDHTVLNFKLKAN